MTKATIEVKRYFFLFFPIASYEKLDNEDFIISIFRLLWVPVYKRVGGVRWLLGKVWRDDNTSPLTGVSYERQNESEQMHEYKFTQAP